MVAIYHLGVIMNEEEVCKFYSVYDNNEYDVDSM